jgi:hypothetical protein
VLNNAGIASGGAEQAGDRTAMSFSFGIFDSFNLGDSAPGAFGDLTPAEAQANLAAFAETVMPAVRQAGQSQA